MNNNYDKIEEEIKEKDIKEKKVKHKVSGKSVFKLQEIIREKSKVPLKEGNADSKEPMVRDG